MADVHDKTLKGRAEREPGNLYDADRQWSRDAGDVELFLPAIVATAQLCAARQHLRAIGALLPVPGVELAIGGAARACCEASARAVAVLDPALTAKDRVVRALNESLHAVPTRSDGGHVKAHTSLAETATRFSIKVHRTANGRITYFGLQPRMSAMDVTCQYLAAEGLQTKAFLPIWRSWNAAAHAGIDAGLIVMADVPQIDDIARAVAALPALLAFARAEQVRADYAGLPRVRPLVPPSA